MRFAYADPPYIGQAKRHYGKHPDYAGEVDHAKLIESLCSDFDGWALSLSMKSLVTVMPMCPNYVIFTAFGISTFVWGYLMGRRHEARAQSGRSVVRSEGAE